MRVLVVEDNPINREYLVELLTARGLDCELAGHGREAVEKFVPGHFDLVVMDCQMPVMDGFEATRQIRDMERAAGAEPVPILAMTANAMSGVHEFCRQMGMDDYISKPYSPDELARHLAGLLPGLASR